MTTSTTNETAHHSNTLEAPTPPQKNAPKAATNGAHKDGFTHMGSLNLKHQVAIEAEELSGNLQRVTIHRRIPSESNRSEADFALFKALCKFLGWNGPIAQSVGKRLHLEEATRRVEEANEYHQSLAHASAGESSGTGCSNF
ncbi:hypothetical protein JCM16814_08170 [Desulfobaculum senezii]